MARCNATTKKGTQCRLNSLEGSEYCAIHLRQDPSAPSGREALEDLEARLSDTVKTILGFAIAAGIVISVLIKRR